MAVLPVLAFTTVEVKFVPFTMMYTVHPFSSRGPQDTHTSVVSDAITVLFRGAHTRSATGGVVSRDKLLLMTEDGSVA